MDPGEEGEAGVKGEPGFYLRNRIDGDAITELGILQKEDASQPIC